MRPLAVDDGSTVVATYPINPLLELALDGSLLVLAKVVQGEEQPPHNEQESNHGKPTRGKRPWSVRKTGNARETKTDQIVEHKDR